ncbi:MAG: tetratricopeptide repeat protein [Xanthobacteraceae bacterium]
MRRSSPNKAVAFARCLCTQCRLDPFAYGRGNAYQTKEDTDRAIADYTQVIAVDPKFAVA